MTSAAKISATLSIGSEEAMTRLGQRLAAVLRPGDTVLLDGPIGAGKTHLARAMIRAMTGPDEDIPSPTYTLVQTYVARGAEIWHVDLYRLADASEILELGLDEAMEDAIVLIEWSDRLPEDMRPATALHVTMIPGADGRAVKLASASGRWSDFLRTLADAVA